MKTKNTKKFVIALALFGGLLFTVQATDIIDLNGQQTTEIRKHYFKIPTHG